jgi:hypothetical protein
MAEKKSKVGNTKMVKKLIEEWNVKYRDPKVLKNFNFDWKLLASNRLRQDKKKALTKQQYAIWCGKKR